MHRIQSSIDFERMLAADRSLFFIHAEWTPESVVGLKRLTALADNWSSAWAHAPIHSSYILIEDFTPTLIDEASDWLDREQPRIPEQWKGFFIGSPERRSAMQFDNGWGNAFWIRNGQVHDFEIRVGRRSDEDIWRRSLAAFLS